MAATRLDDWPRTTRVLPWMIAVFIAMLWLVPFDTISMTASLPFQLKLDRIVLPVVFIAWGLSLLAGGRGAPRLRTTPVHLAVGTYVAVSFLSVILSVGPLNHLLLLQTSLKQLVLLSSYALLFVIVASVVRPSEVRAFVKYSLALAVVCGIGALWQFHFHYNPFYQWAHTLLPSSVFQAPLPDAAAVDELGRPVLLGPGESPLELATMMALALPIALVGVMRSDRWRPRILYVLAACVLLAAGFATYRKSSLVLPLVLVVTLAIFRPRHVVRLLPIACVLFVLVHILASGAITGVIAELTGSKLTSAGTTVHRTDGYDAIRPLVWAHPAFGQGYGSYNANVLRILDSQVLMSLVETGIVGLLAYFAMMLTTFGSARTVFRNRSSDSAWLGLTLGCSAIVFFTSSFLFDTMSFPHGPYLFLTFAAFVSVLGEPSVRPALHGRLHGTRRLPATGAPLLSTRRRVSARSTAGSS